MKAIKPISMISLPIICACITHCTQEKSARQAGAADLDAWSRCAIGEAGQFTNPDTEDWIPFIPPKDDVTGGGILDADPYVEKSGGQYGFLKQDGKGNFIFEDGIYPRFVGGQIPPFPEKEEAA